MEEMRVPADTADLILRLARALSVHHAITLGREIPHDFEAERGHPHPLVERAHKWLELHAPELVKAEAGEPVCSSYGGQLIHIAGPGVEAVVCPVCDHDSSALDDSELQ
jgi:hypothetical protein